MIADCIDNRTEDFAIKKVKIVFNNNYEDDIMSDILEDETEDSEDEDGTLIIIKWSNPICSDIPGEA